VTKITNSQFSMQAAFLASNAAKWAADALTLPEDANKPMLDWPLEWFLEDMRGRLDRIEAWAKEPAENTEQARAGAQPEKREGAGR